MYRAWESKKVASDIPLSIFTYTSPSRLEALEAQCAGWPGPHVSAIYVYLPVHAANASVADRANPSEPATVSQLAPAHLAILISVEKEIQIMFDR